MDHHPHLHALVPGGGPSPDGGRWVTSRHPTQRNRRKPYLVDNVLLGQTFREKFTDGFRRLVRGGKLRLEGDWAILLEPQELEAWLIEVTESDWNVFIEGPPKGKSNPVWVLKYLACYMTGGPISNRRIIRDENDHVTFWARSKNKAEGNRPRPFELCGKEFVRRRPTFGRCPNAHSAKGLHPFSLLRWIPRRQTQRLSPSLPGVTNDRQSPTDQACRTRRSEPAEVSAMRHRDELHRESGASELEGRLPARDLRESGDLFADASHRQHGLSRLSTRTVPLAMMPTTHPTLTARTVAGISRPNSLSGSESAPRPNLFHYKPLVGYHRASGQAPIRRRNLPSSVNR